MTQQVPASKRFSTDLLEAIVAEAAGLWERTENSGLLVGLADGDHKKTRALLDRWCHNIAEGNWDLLRKRLRWDQLDLEGLPSQLGNVRFSSKTRFPSWSATLQQIIQAAGEGEPKGQPPLPTDPLKPIPFEDILLPAVFVARKQLLARWHGSARVPLGSFAPVVLSKAAYISLERDLLQHLAELCHRTLMYEFSQTHSFGRVLLMMLDLETGDNDDHKSEYLEFVTELLEDGLFPFFRKYPVLARLVATTVEQWIESTHEFLLHTAEDMGAIQELAATNLAGHDVAADQAWEWETEEIEKSAAGGTKRVARASVQSVHPYGIANLQASLSDRHNGGRTVIAVNFNSGLKLIYKPKDLALEVAYNRFLEWCNQQKELLEFRLIPIVNRRNHGWVEYVQHESCVDEAAAARFYRRAGMLLCIMYILGGTDCHSENLVASGEHPVLVDMETLLQADPNPTEDLSGFVPTDASIVETFANSVLRSGLLPRWEIGADGLDAYDVGGLGSSDVQQCQWRVPRWKAINTGNMHLGHDMVQASVAKNVLCLGQRALCPADYQAQITQGFEEMYRFLMKHKDELLGPNSPLAAMYDKPVRFVFRGTRVYRTIQEQSLAPDHLRDGAEYSVHLDQLSCAFLAAQQRPEAWPILRAELRAMERLDFPLFTANTSSDELRLDNGQLIADYFKGSAYQNMLRRLHELSSIDMAWQIGIIEGAFHAKGARITAQSGDSSRKEFVPVLDSDEFLYEASAIAGQIEARAIASTDGSLKWIGLGCMPHLHRYELQLVGHDLYSGCCGVALFFAALHHLTQMPSHRDLALRALEGLRREIRSQTAESSHLLARITGIGGATGLGSIMYAFVVISRYLRDSTLLDDARRLADWITSDLIARDRILDVIGGAAGAILGLLSLHDVTGDGVILSKACSAGAHLLAHQSGSSNSPRAWRNLWAVPLTGFSHGAAGISYALLRLYAATGQRQYLEAAIEGISYERSVFSESNANWPDFRELDEKKEASFPVSWCHGAAGIGLARLGSYGIFTSQEVERDIHIAVKTTQNSGLCSTDNLCCGNMGRIELLLVGAKRCRREDWSQAALQYGSEVVIRARRNGAYQLFSNLPQAVFTPGLFQGLAGIGYQLLRLADAHLLSVLLWE